MFGWRKQAQEHETLKHRVRELEAQVADLARQRERAQHELRLVHALIKTQSNESVTRLLISPYLEARGVFSVEDAERVREYENVSLPSVTELDRIKDSLSELVRQCGFSLDALDDAVRGGVVVSKEQGRTVETGHYEERESGAGYLASDRNAGGDIVEVWVDDGPEYRPGHYRVVLDLDTFSENINRQREAGANRS